MSQNNSTTDHKKPVVISQDGEIEEYIEEFQVDRTLLSERESGIAHSEYGAQSDHTSAQERKNAELSKLLNFKSALFVIGSFLMGFLLGVQLTSDNIEYEFANTENVITANVENKGFLEDIRALKNSAHLILRDTESNINLVDDFLAKWESLDDSPKLVISTAPWFKRFSNLIEQQILNQKQFDASVITANNDYPTALSNMASSIGLVIVDNNQETITTDANFEDIFKEISAEIAKAEVDKQNLTTQVVQENKPDVNEVITKSNINKKPTEATPIKEVVKTSRKTKATRNTRGFTENDVSFLLGQYTASYEIGSADKILNLFNTHSDYKKKLKNSYRKVFSYSSSRNITFSDLNWKYYKNTIIGKGKYKAAIKLKNNGGTRYVDAKIRLKLRATKDSLRIARINFSKVKSNTIKPINSSKLLPALQKKLTVSELQDVIARFINAYEAGDTKSLGRIFSNNAKINGTESLIGIQKDYKDLFLGTSDRQLFIQNVKWSIHEDRAKGRGRVNTLIVAEGSHNVVSQQGDIEITAKKINNKVYISHLYHHLK